MRRLPSFLVNLVLLGFAVSAIIWSVSLVHGPGVLTRRIVAASSPRTVTVAKGTVTATVSAPGTLATATSANANFVTSGPVIAIGVKVGDSVRQGAVLAKVDPAAAQRALALAQANLVAAADAVSRAASAGLDPATADAALAQAKLALADAQAGVAGTKLVAPMTGTVVAVNGSLGSIASTSAASSASSAGLGTGAGADTGSAGGGGSAVSGMGTSLTNSGVDSAASSNSSGFVQIADLNRLQVTANFAEADAVRLKPGQLVVVSWNALTGVTATGQIVSVDPSGTSANGVVTYPVTASIRQLPTGARPGQSVTVSAVTATASNATFVNSAAITRAGSEYLVNVAGADGVTRTRKIEVGVQGDEGAQILSGLTVGEQVVLPAATPAASTNTTGFGGPGAGGNGGPG